MKAQPPTKFYTPVMAVSVLSEQAEIVRWSSVKQRLLDAGHPDVVKVLNELRLEVGTSCPVHGELEDPIVVTAGENVCFGCPKCSGPAVQKQWEEEGRTGKA
jgi:hypothetical protein